MRMEWRRYAPEGETVDRIYEWVQETCDSLGTDSREKQRLRLTVEEVLLRILDHSEGVSGIEAGIGSRFGKRLLLLRYDGAPFDPTVHEGDDWSERILDSLGLSPAWSCRGQTNLVSFTLAERVRHSATFGILLAVAVAAILGFSGRLLPEAFRTGLDTILLTPLTNGFLGLLNTFAGLMIAFAICSGILGMGDPATLRKTGKRFLTQIVLLCAASSVLAFVLGIPALGARLSVSAQSQFSQAEKIIETLFAILPSDPVSPFLNRNTMQIIVIAMFIGVGLLALGERADPLRELVDRGTQLFSQLMVAVCRLIPVFVSAALLRQLWSDSGTAYLSVWKPLALTAGLIALFVLLMLLLTAWQIRCPVSLLFRKILPPFLVAFTTASSIAAFQRCMETGKEKLGIERSFLHFAYPIGSVMYMPAAAIFFTVLSVHFAGEYGLAVTLPWLVTAVITISLLAIAVPPLPGSGFMIFSTLFAQLGIPPDALVLATLMYVPLDYAIAGGDIAALLLELTREAGQLKILDRTTLLKP